jgi:hypothetical protein
MLLTKDTFFSVKGLIKEGSIYFQLYDCLRISEEEKGKEVGVEPITVRKYGKGEPKYARALFSLMRRDGKRAGKSKGN